MICKSCGKEISNGSRFCKYCGMSFNQQKLPETDSNNDDVDKVLFINEKTVLNKNKVRIVEPVMYEDLDNDNNKTEKEEHDYSNRVVKTTKEKTDRKYINVFIACVVISTGCFLFRKIHKKKKQL